MRIASRLNFIVKKLYRCDGLIVTLADQPFVAVLAVENLLSLFGAMEFASLVSIDRRMILFVPHF